MKKEDFLIIGAGLFILVIIILIAIFLPPKPKEVKVITDTEDYKIGEQLKVKIENNLEKNICFSSCYPYYFEKKNGQWADYNYINCPDSNLAEDCINPRDVKAFELVIPDLKEGIHRIVVSACIGCNLNDSFEEDQRFYSNTFIIK